MAPSFRRSLGSRDTTLSILIDKGRLRRSVDHDFYLQLEHKARESEAAHLKALAAAAAHHEQIRQRADIIRETVELEIENERARHAEAERVKLEQARREKAEREVAEKRRLIAEAQRVEAEKRKAEEDIRAKAEADVRKQREETERQQQEAARAAAERHKQHSLQKQKEQEEAAAAAAAAAIKAREEQKRHAQIPAAVTPTSPSQRAPNLGKEASISDGFDGKQQHYVEVHRRLKQLRHDMLGLARQEPNLKKQLGEMRREIRKSVGQLTEGRGANKAPVSVINTIFKKAVGATSTPMIDPCNYIPTLPPTQNANRQSTLLPSVFLYLLNIFAKAIINQFISEAGVTPKAADPVGIVCVQIFSSPDYLWEGHTLIDILIAKFRIVCPVLWGIHGFENTSQGKDRLSWWRESKLGPFVSEQRHSERMTGLGAGYAAIALRNFSKSQNLKAPYPNHYYWASLACIVNLGPERAEKTHYEVLKAMIEGYEKRILEFYGSAALVALRKALKDFPAQARERNAASLAVGVLPDALRRDYKLTL